MRKLLSVCHVPKAKHVICRLGEGDVVFPVCVVAVQCLMLHAPKQLKLPWLGGMGSLMGCLVQPGAFLPIPELKTSCF